MATKAPFNRRLAALELAVDELEIGMFRSPSGPGTISGKAIKPKTVTAGLVNVSSLEAVNAKTGNLNVTGAITMEQAGATFSAGQSAYNTGSPGWWLEWNAGTPRFSLGNPSGNRLTWNGTTLAITGTITAGAGTIGGFSIGATDLTTDAGATGLASSGSQRIWVGSATPSAAPFRVSSTGVATMIGAVIGSATSGARVELNPTNGVSVYDSGGTVRGRLLTTGAGYLGSTDGTSATAALSWTTAGVATINASAITTGTLNASTITVSNLNATNLTTGTFGNGAAGLGLGGTNGVTINGQLLVSGGSIKTGTSGARIELDNTNGIRGYNSASTLQFQIKNSDGAGYFSAGNAALTANGLEFIGSAVDVTRAVRWSTSIGGTPYGVVAASSVGALTLAHAYNVVMTDQSYNWKHTFWVDPSYYGHYQATGNLYPGNGSGVAQTGYYVGASTNRLVLAGPPDFAGVTTYAAAGALQGYFSAYINGAGIVKIPYYAAS